ncbi:MAG: HDIG domain-containing protein [Deltaproteobacteria bacterium]|nr:HDIG domain-containing protein [Deltaproteobacteria bacterium]
MKNREESLKILKEKVKTKNLIKHMLAVEAIMKGIAKRLDEDEYLWGIAGLLHDIDIDEYGKEPTMHGKVGAEWLKQIGYDDKIVNAVLAHAGHKTPENSLEIALFASDPLSGLIISSALIHPEKRLNAIDTNFVLNRFCEKRFAAGARREDIKRCEDLGLSLEEFITIALNSMKEISGELGL